MFVYPRKISVTKDVDKIDTKALRELFASCASNITSLPSFCFSFGTTLVIGTQTFPSVVASSKKDSKLKAAESALNTLKISIPSADTAEVIYVWFFVCWVLVMKLLVIVVMDVCKNWNWKQPFLKQQRFKNTQYLFQKGFYSFRQSKMKVFFIYIFHL